MRGADVVGLLLPAWSRPSLVKGSSTANAVLCFRELDALKRQFNIQVQRRRGRPLVRVDPNALAPKSRTGHRPALGIHLINYLSSSLEDAIYGQSHHPDESP